MTILRFVCTLSALTTLPACSNIATLGESPARKALRAREYDKALALAQASAKAGNAEGFYLLGRLYQWGVGVSQNQALSTQNLKTAAAKGEIHAQLLVVLEDKPPRDVAITRLIQLKHQNDPLVQHARAIIGASDNECPTLQQERALTKAADEGETFAALVVAIQFLEAGQGCSALRQDAEQAKRYLTMILHSSALTDSVTATGILYGIEANPDPKKRVATKAAVDLIKPVADAGFFDIQKLYLRVCAVDPDHVCGDQDLFNYVSWLRNHNAINFAENLVFGLAFSNRPEPPHLREVKARAEKWQPTLPPINIDYVDYRPWYPGLR